VIKAMRNMREIGHGTSENLLGSCTMVAIGCQGEGTLEIDGGQILSTWSVASLA
jgi:hypothetical protein